MKLSIPHLLLVAYTVAPIGVVKSIDVTVGHDATELVNSLLGRDSGITIVSSALTGHPDCAGLFTDAKSAVPFLFDSGLVISSGGPTSLDMNDYENESTCHKTPGDSDLNKITQPYSTQDACILELEFTADRSVESVEFQYCFGSDEFLEWSMSQFTDAFALYLNGENIAMIPGTNTPVSINNINQNVNSEYFNSNKLNAAEVPYPRFEADGFTDTFKASGPLQAGTNTLKIAIADTSDCVYDSWVLLEGNSLQGTSCPAETPAEGSRCFFEGLCDYGHLKCSDSSVHPSMICQCIDGTVQCQPSNACPALPPGASGDPHVTTWNGQKFDFHGECDLVLFNNPRFTGGLGMSVQIRTKIESWWSYIEAAAIEIGDQVLELKGGLDGEGPHYWINGVPGDEDVKNDQHLKDLEKYLTARLAVFSVHYKKISSKQHKFRIDLPNGDAISMQTWKHLVAVHVNAKKNENFAGAAGLMGSYPSGSMIGRDGKTVISDEIVFGQEWQVSGEERMLFHSTEGAQYPTKCIMPDQAKMEASKQRRLGESLIARDSAQLACARATDQESCISDVLAMNDIEVAGAY